MSFLVGIGAMLTELFKTLVIDSIIKIILNPDEFEIPKIKIGVAVEGI